FSKLEGFVAIHSLIRGVLGDRPTADGAVSLPQRYTLGHWNQGNAAAAPRGSLKEPTEVSVARRARAGSTGESSPAVLLAEFVDAASRVNDLLLAGEERMAARADLDVQVM